MWHKEAPKTEGVYWVYQNCRARIVTTWRYSSRPDTLYTNEDGGAPIDGIYYSGALWCGPIVMPEFKKPKKRFEFFIPGQLPGLNEIIAASKVSTKFGKKIVFNKYSKMKNGMTEYIRTFLPKLERPLQRCSFEFTWVEKNKRRDPDNVAAGGRKFIFDAMVTAKLIENDGWKNIQSWSDVFDADRNNYGVKVIVTNCE